MKVSREKINACPKCGCTTWLNVSEYGSTVYECDKCGWDYQYGSTDCGKMAASEDSICQGCYRNPCECLPDDCNCDPE